MAPLTRKTGLSVLGEMPWGTHFCLFYETKEDLLCGTRPLFQGWAGEQRIWPVGAFQRLASDEGRRLERATARCSRTRTICFETKHRNTSHEEWFFPGGAFDLGRVIGVLDDKLAQALAENHEGLRLTRSTAWLQREVMKHFQAFEHALDESMATKPIITLCTFPLAMSGADEILSAAQTHHFTVAIRKGIWQVLETAEAKARTHSPTPRALEVLHWAAQGKTAWEIAKILQITKRTVDEHIQTAVRRLGAANKSHAIAIALRNRIHDLRHSGFGEPQAPMN